MHGATNDEMLEYLCSSFFNFMTEFRFPAMLMSPAGVTEKKERHRIKTCMEETATEIPYHS